jgi:hypothetical protein
VVAQTGVGQQRVIHAHLSVAERDLGLPASGRECKWSVCHCLIDRLLGCGHASCVLPASVAAGFYEWLAGSRSA